VRFLIIDDDEDLRALLEHFIKEQWTDAFVEQFDPLKRDMPDASFALGSYDVIILDYMLGQGDGLQWLQAFKRRADCPPVLFLTGAGNEIIAVRAMKAGADDYQRKQELTRERLIGSLRACLLPTLFALFGAIVAVVALPLLAARRPPLPALALAAHPEKAS
jgi:DNA-binding response OmpR family regulator